jgi:hypothetical protein
MSKIEESVKAYALQILALLFPTLAFAQGGPPMVTDDPGTPGDKHWEINLAGLLASTPNQAVLQAPYLDLNYGWGEHTQLKVETGWVNLHDSGADSRRGAGTVLVGVKYRFVDEEKDGVSVSTYPQIQFRHFFSSHDPEIAPPGNQYILPIELSKTLGTWEINPEVGYLYGTTVSSELFYGVVFAYEDAKPWEPLFEIHVNSRFDGSGNTTLVNLGLRYAFNPNLNLLLAAGHTVTHPNDESLEFDGYLGLQIDL